MVGTDAVGKWIEDNKRTVATVTFAGTVLALIVTVFTIVNAVKGYFRREEFHFGTATLPYAPLTEPQAKKEDVEKIRSYRYMTLVGLPNPTSTQLSNIVVLVPRKGYVGITESYVGLGRDTWKVKTFREFDGRIDIPEIPPRSALGITIWHNEPVKPDEQVEVSSEQTGKITLPFHTLTETVSPFYKVFFWVFVLALLVIVARKAWKVMRKNGAKQASSVQPSSSPAMGTQQKRKEKRVRE